MLPTRISPVSVLVNNAIAARVWFLLALAGWGFAVLSPYLTIQAMKQKEKAIVLDGAGNVVYAPVLGFEEASQLYAYHVRLACLGLLQRNPKGPDIPDLIDRLYLEQARAQAVKLIQSTEQEFAQKQIHQKVEITSIHVLETRTVDQYEAYAVEAKGQLIKTGKVNDLAFIEPTPFSIRFLFLRNQDLLSNSKLPLAVYQFEFRDLSKTISGANP